MGMVMIGTTVVDGIGILSTVTTRVITATLLCL